MAQTETPQGSTLHWPDETAQADQPVAVDAARTEEVESPDMVDTSAAPEAEAAVTAPATLTTGRRATKIMTDLSRAMQTAAVGSRDETMARFSADAKVAVEEIEAAATGEGADIRRRADDDVAAVREWSKGEIARIREEAEARIAVRKGTLDSEMEEHASVVQTRIERVNATVKEFEEEMGSFFERLLSLDDPTRIATMAETMPEPPDLAGVAASITSPAIAPFDPIPPTAPTWPEDTLIGDTPSEPAQTDDPEPLISDGSEASETDAPAAVDFAAAEAEAAAFTGELSASDEGTIDVSGAGATEPTAEQSQEASEAPEAPAAGERSVTRVSVVGLVSVASIASFKRSLGRAAGVSGIRVASGPDGEFVFTVEHDAGISLSDAITALPGFEARVTGQADGSLDIAAHDPDTDA
jgi:hypothetical protein